VGVRGFGQVGVIGFSARKSFEAVAGSSFGWSFGGGVEIRFRSGLFVQGSLEQYRRTGQRVYAFEGESFPLGIPSTVTIRPMVVGLGYRPPAAGLVLPYVGVGIGQYRLRETSLFEDPTERVDEIHVGYHGYIGVEFRTHRWIAPAAEARYTRVPGSLGNGGASAQFDESDLGGWQVTGKILIGQ
jgi:opacity protein-like surface antigen